MRRSQRPAQRRAGRGAVGGDSALVQPFAPGSGPMVRVHAGPDLLLGPAAGPRLAAHRRVVPEPEASLEELLDRLDEVDLRGRGGAGFPFARKLRAAAGAGGRPVVVVNLAEGEPASFKDAALALTRPHLVLDGAAAVARALGAREVHVVLPGERAGVGQVIRDAVDERAQGRPRLRFRTHTADPRFVAGQARAVVELLSGRREPARDRLASRGRGRVARPAHAARRTPRPSRTSPCSRPTRDAARTPCCSTVSGDTGRPEVAEVRTGTPWSEVLPAGLLDRPVLVGGYHGTWAAPGTLSALRVCRDDMAQAGLALGAGVVLPLPDDDCPVARTARLVRYLAGQSAGRCGPCLNGLPALADAVGRVARGEDGTDRVAELCRLVERRGACAHPDGTARLVRSLLAAFPAEVEQHGRGSCSHLPAPRVLTGVHQ